MLMANQNGDDFIRAYNQLIAQSVVPVRPYPPLVMLYTAEKLLTQTMKIQASSI